MSYCRFSSCGFRSDVYVYDNGFGIVIIVAANRFVDTPDRPPPLDPPPFPNGDPSEISAWSRYAVANAMRVTEWARTAKRERITLPHAGETFSGLTHADAADKLLELKALGYIVPEGVVEALREDAPKETT